MTANLCILHAPTRPCFYAHVYTWACKLLLVDLLVTNLIFVSPWHSTYVRRLAAYDTDHVFMLYGILTFAGSSNRCASKDNNEEAIFHNPGKFSHYFSVSIINYLKSDLIFF